MKVNILGTEYEVVYGDKDSIPALEKVDGICDETLKRICIDKMTPTGANDELGDLTVYNKKVLRHEIIHAFMFESGLAECSAYAKNEELIDWIARQFPKMLKSFTEAYAL